MENFTVKIQLQCKNHDESVIFIFLSITEFFRKLFIMFILSTVVLGAVVWPWAISIDIYTDSDATSILLTYVLHIT